MPNHNEQAPKNTIFYYPYPQPGQPDPYRNLFKKKQDIEKLLYGVYNNGKRAGGLDTLESARVLAPENVDAKKNNEQFLNRYFTITPTEMNEFVPGIRDFTATKKPGAAAIANIQSKTQVYIDSEFLGKPDDTDETKKKYREIVQKVLKGTAWKESLAAHTDPNNPVHQWTLLANTKIIVSEDTRAYDHNYRKTENQQPFKVFSVPAFNLREDSALSDRYGAINARQLKILEETFEDNEKLKEFLIHHFSFQLNVMKEQGIKVPVLTDMSAIEHGCHPQIVAEAWRDVLDRDVKSYGFDAIVFALPQQEDNSTLELFKREFKINAVGNGYNEINTPVFMLNADPIDTAAQLANSGYKTGLQVLSPALSIAGRYWRNNDQSEYTIIPDPSAPQERKKLKEHTQAGLPEMYATRLTNYVIAQHPKMNPDIATISKWKAVAPLESCKLDSDAKEEALAVQEQDIGEILKTVFDHISFSAITHPVLPKHPSYIKEDQILADPNLRPVVILDDRGLVIKFPEKKILASSYGSALQNKYSIKSTPTTNNTLIISNPIAIVRYINLIENEQGKEIIKVAAWDASLAGRLSEKNTYELIKSAEKLQRDADNKWIAEARKKDKKRISPQSGMDSSQKKETSKAHLIIHFKDEEGISHIVTIRDEEGNLSLPGGNYAKTDSSLKETALRTSHEITGGNEQHGNGLMEVGHTLGMDTLKLNQENLYKIAEITRNNGVYEVAYTLDLGKLTHQEIHLFKQKIENDNPEKTVEVLPFDRRSGLDVEENEANSTDTRHVTTVIHPSSNSQADIFTSTALTHFLDFQENFYEEEYGGMQTPLKKHAEDERRFLQTVTLQGGKNNELIDWSRTRYTETDTWHNIYYTPQTEPKRPAWWKEPLREAPIVPPVENEQGNRVPEVIQVEEAEQPIERIEVNPPAPPRPLYQTSQVITAEAELKELLQNKERVKKPSIICYTFPSLHESTIHTDPNTYFVYRTVQQKTNQHENKAYFSDFNNTIGVTTHTRPGRTITKELSKEDVRISLLRDFEKMHVRLAEEKNIVIPTLENGEFSLGRKSGFYNDSPELESFIKKQVTKLENHAKIIQNRETTAPQLTTHTQITNRLGLYGYKHTLATAITDFCGISTDPNLVIKSGNKLEINFTGTARYGIINQDQATANAIAAAALFERHHINFEREKNAPEKLIITNPEEFIRFHLELGLGFYQHASKELKQNRTIEKDERLQRLMNNHSEGRDEIVPHSKFSDRPRNPHSHSHHK